MMMVRRGEGRENKSIKGGEVRGEREEEESGNGFSF